MIIVTDETFIERKGTERYFNGKVKKKSRKWYLKSNSDNRICISRKFIENCFCTDFSLNPIGIVYSQKLNCCILHTAGFLPTEYTEVCSDLTYAGPTGWERTGRLDDTLIKKEPNFPLLSGYRRKITGKKSKIYFNLITYRWKKM